MRALKDLFLKYPAAAAAGVALFAAFAAFYAATVTNIYSFDPKYAIYMDVLNLYWIPSLSDPALFPRDPVAAQCRSMWGPFITEGPWIWLSSLFMRVKPYALGMALLSSLGCAAAALLVFRLALKSAARPAAAAAALLFAVYFLSTNTFFGVPRLYGFLAFLAFLLAAEEKRFLLLPFLIPAGFILYPAVSAGLGVSALLAPVFYRRHFREHKLLPRYAAAMAAAGLLCLAALWRSVTLGGVFRALGAGSGFEIDKLYQFVSAPVRPDSLWDLVTYFLLNFNEHGNFYPVMSALLLLVFLAGWCVKLGRPALLPASLKLSLAGSLGAFALLYLTHPVSASRQMVFIVPLVVVFLAAEGVYRLGGEKPRTLLVGVAAALVFGVLHPRLGLRESCRTFAPVYGYLSALPPDAIVAGHPDSDLLHTIPVFAKKQVFISDEHRDQYLFTLNRSADFTAMRAALVSALYSASPAAACALKAAYGVDYVALEDKFFTPEYLARAAASSFPLDAETARAAAKTADPLGFYNYARARPAFSWKNERSGGAVFALSSCVKKEARK
ncbi:MAG: hypothetical protein A2X35_03300 [Elusimicrobia bacterium GWA2_61_42]|nr:MAG: hypothetical protein A2X35_03300 [Elusimicrobia bacterium GWA2_61_42]OGR77612.1 MAG: hypothetical protein A2X38_09540 [Elusimicrobia bacterium GWC2_61_25]